MSMFEIDLNQRLTIDEKFKPYLLYGLYELNRVWLHDEWHMGIFIQLNSNDKPHCRFTIEYELYDKFLNELNRLRKKKLPIRRYLDVWINEVNKELVRKLYLENMSIKMEDKYVIEEEIKYLESLVSAKNKFLREKIKKMEGELEC